MKRLVILVVAGLMGLLLAACGEQAKTSTKTETTSVEQTTSGEPAAAPATEAAPASEAPSDAAASDAQKPE